MAIEMLQQRKILVVGLGKTGLSVGSYLHRYNIAFDVVDDRAEPPNLLQLQQLIPAINCFHQFDESLFCEYDLLIVSPGLPVAMPAIQAAVALGAEVIGDVELFAQVVTAPVIAVTGSNGKSTVVAWLASVLAESAIKAVPCGNIGVPVLDALDDTADLYILEVSSFQLETTHSLQALSATVLNISDDHLDRYNDVEHYAQTKRRIYKQANLAVINATDQRTHPLSAENELTVGFAVEGCRENCVGLRDHQGETWLVSDQTRIIRESELPLPGWHNSVNAQAVIALSRPLSLPVAVLREGLKKFTGLRHRTQLVAELRGVRWYNDSKGTNVDACCKAIEAMRAPVVLIAGGLSKDADFTPLRPLVEAHVKALVLIGQDADKLYQALHDLASCEYADSMPDAVGLAARVAVEGDAVLLSPACASFDMFDSFEHRGEVFIDSVLEMAA